MIKKVVLFFKVASMDKNAPSVSSSRELVGSSRIIRPG
jgi:hypothetical protein